MAMRTMRQTGSTSMNYRILPIEFAGIHGFGLLATATNGVSFWAYWSRDEISCQKVLEEYQLQALGQAILDECAAT